MDVLMIYYKVYQMNCIFFSNLYFLCNQSILLEKFRFKYIIY